MKKLLIVLIGLVFSILFSSTATAFEITPNTPNMAKIEDTHLFMPQLVETHTKLDNYVYNACLMHSVDIEFCYQTMRYQFDFSGSGFTDLEKKQYVFHNVYIYSLFYNF